MRRLFLLIPLGDMYPRRALIILSLFLSAFAALLMAVSQNIFLLWAASLLLGILTGSLIYTIGSGSDMVIVSTVENTFKIMVDKVDFNIILFCSLLGALVYVISMAGGSRAYGKWAAKKIKGRRSALLSTSALGAFIFIDDYFNCLTVGSVMRPVTDKHNVSRAKLAYLIDATAAPVCIIAPISSWAAAVTGFVEGEDGFSIFIRAIPYNYYALLTITMMLALVLLKVDYGPMKLHEENARKGDLYTTPDRPYAGMEEEINESKGKVIDLVFPILVLIVCCVIGMIYTGGFFSGAGIVEAFSGSDASVGLMFGSFFAFVIVTVFYALRRVLSFGETMVCVPEAEPEDVRLNLERLVDVQEMNGIAVMNMFIQSYPGSFAFMNPRYPAQTSQHVSPLNGREYVKQEYFLPHHPRVRAALAHYMGGGVRDAVAAYKQRHPGVHVQEMKMLNLIKANVMAKHLGFDDLVSRLEKSIRQRAAFLKNQGN